jgi:hypothetical protein
MMLPMSPTMKAAWAVPRVLAFISPRSIDFISDRPMIAPTTDKGPQHSNPAIDSTNAVVA